MLIQQMSFSVFIALSGICIIAACNKPATLTQKNGVDTVDAFLPDTTKIPNDSFGAMVRYGRELMLRTAYYIGPKGIAGKYTNNIMNCTQCHQWAGTKPYSFNLMRSHERYPQYRAREGKVITLSDRINNCVTRPHNGKPIPLESREMTALLTYYRWINMQIPKGVFMRGEMNLSIQFPLRAASPQQGKSLYLKHCSRCHGTEGEGKMDSNNMAYAYPSLWGKDAYQSGSSMHRIIKQAQWLKANMPFDQAVNQKNILSDAEALDLAAFINDDDHHPRPQPATRDYPNAKEKAIDYDHGPFADPFSERQHKFGPYLEMISWWKAHDLHPSY